MKTSSKSAVKAEKKVAPKKAVAEKKAPAKKVAAKESSISKEAISQRATEIYIESGCIPGRDFENWIQAERELKGKKK